MKLSSVLEFREFFVAPYWFGAPCFALTLRLAFQVFLKTHCAVFLMEWRDPLLQLPSSSEFLTVSPSAVFFPRASLEVSFPFSACGSGSPLFSGLPHLIRSALEVSHLFSGLLLPLPFGFVSPRNALGISLQSFLLQEIGSSSRRPLPSCRWLLRVPVDRDPCIVLGNVYKFAVRLQGFVPS